MSNASSACNWRTYKTQTASEQRRIRWQTKIVLTKCQTAHQPHFMLSAVRMYFLWCCWIVFFCFFFSFFNFYFMFICNCICRLFCCSFNDSNDVKFTWKFYVCILPHRKFYDEKYVLNFYVKSHCSCSCNHENHLINSSFLSHSKSLLSLSLSLATSLSRCVWISRFEPRLHCIYLNVQNGCFFMHAFAFERMTNVAKSKK